MNLSLALAVIFASTYFLGKVVERLRIPWIFAALLVGVAATFYNPFSEVTAGSQFQLLSELGLYFILFIIGYEIDMGTLKKQGGFIVKTSFAVISAEAIVGTVVLHALFDVTWPIAALVAASFATVGEAVLLPILDEFHLLSTSLGQTILGVGVIDDIVEIATVFVATFLIGESASHNTGSELGKIAIVTLVFVLPVVLYKIHSYLTRGGEKYGFEYFFLFAMAILFLLLGVGQWVDATALAAILAGIALKNSLPRRYLHAIESEVKALSYGFFGPVFFFAVGLETSFDDFLDTIWLIVVITVVTAMAKIIVSYFMGRKTLGPRESIIMGIGLTIRLSTSIVVITLLYLQHLISSELYSALIGSTIVFKFINPPLMAYLIQRWHIAEQPSDHIQQRRRKTISLTTAS